MCSCTDNPAPCFFPVAGLIRSGGFTDAHLAFQSLGKMSILLMLIVGAACAFAAIGLARNRLWGRNLGLIILAVNLIGDLTNVFVRHDLRTLIGLPIAGAMIFYLLRARNWGSREI